MEDQKGDYKVSPEETKAEQTTSDVSDDVSSVAETASDQAAFESPDVESAAEQPDVEPVVEQPDIESAAEQPDIESAAEQPSAAQSADHGQSYAQQPYQQAPNYQQPYTQQPYAQQPYAQQSYATTQGGSYAPYQTSYQPPYNPPVYCDPNEKMTSGEKAFDIILSVLFSFIVPITMWFCWRKVAPAKARQSLIWGLVTCVICIAVAILIAVLFSSLLIVAVSSGLDPGMVHGIG